MTTVRLPARSSQPRARAFWGMLAGAAGIVATGCGPSPEPQAASLESPPRDRAVVSLTPALELPSDPSTLARRIVVEEIQVGLAEARLLGAHPSLPPGGLPLLDTAEVVAKAPGSGPAWRAPFPPRHLHDKGLAVYFRIERNGALRAASIVVRGRLRIHPAGAALDPTGATDPDGDPARGHPDPIPEQRHDTPVGATDPDGDPAWPKIRLGPARRADGSIPFELRDNQPADLVASLQNPTDFDVVAGIPAIRWFTPQVVTQLNLALASRRRSPDAPGAKPSKPSGGLTIVVKPRAAHPGLPPRAFDPRRHRDGVLFLSNKMDPDRLTVSRGR